MFRFLFVFAGSTILFFCFGLLTIGRREWPVGLLCSSVFGLIAAALDAQP